MCSHLSKLSRLLDQRVAAQLKDAPHLVQSGTNQISGRFLPLKKNSVENRAISRFTMKNEEKCPKSAIFGFGTGENRDEAELRAKQWTFSDLYRKRCHGEET
jgi:hypothetical protein